MNIKINLNNNLTFSILLLIVIYVLTYVNNYFFYSYVKIRDYQEIRFLAKTIHFNVDKCMINKKNKVECINDIEVYLEKIKPHCTLHLSTIKYNLIKKRHQNRNLVYIPKYLQHIDSIDENLYISKKSVPNIFLATFRSITFSVIDFIEKAYKEGWKEAVSWYYQEKIYLRSVHVLVFAFFAYIVFFLLRIKQKNYQNLIQEQDNRIVKLSKNIYDFKRQEKEFKDTLNTLKSVSINLQEKMQKYNEIINPPIDILKYEDLLNLDPESIIFKCRKVLEKLISQLYLSKFNNRDLRNLNDMIFVLKKEEILNQKSASYANTIRAFGNISAHPSLQNPVEFTKEDAKIISNALILFIDELHLEFS